MRYRRPTTALDVLRWKLQLPEYTRGRSLESGSLRLVLVLFGNFVDFENRPLTACMLEASASHCGFGIICDAQPSARPAPRCSCIHRQDFNGAVAPHYRRSFPSSPSYAGLGAWGGSFRSIAANVPIGVCEWSRETGKFASLSCCVEPALQETAVEKRIRTEFCLTEQNKPPPPPPPPPPGRSFLS